MDAFVGSLEVIEPTDLPASVAPEMRQRSALYTKNSGLMPDEFNHLFRLKSCGVTTYIAEHVKEYEAVDDSESTAHFVDVNDSETQIGYGELRFALTNTSLFFAGKPFVGWTRTKDEHQREGLGTRRLHVMNLASLALHGLPLHSSTLVSDAQVGVWEKLVSQGVALKYNESGVPDPKGRGRYVFVN